VEQIPLANLVSPAAVARVALPVVVEGVADEV
jgi:hypothetical protein